MSTQLTLFDYATLDSNTRDFVQQKTDEIRVIAKRASKDIIEIGKALNVVKKKLKHGEFGVWHQAEFGWSVQTVTNFMQAARRFDENHKFYEFTPSILYMMAAPATPDSAIDELLEHLQSGEKVDVRTAREIIRRHKARQKPKTNRAGDKYIPQGFDACQTPPEALIPLLPHLYTDWRIWECASGEGLLVEELSIRGFDVIASDILTDQNFFEYIPPQWDCLVTNPPYSIKYDWIEHCYKFGKPFALLLPVETLGAKTAQEFFRDCGLEVIFLDRRINFKMPNKGWEGSAAQFPVAWFTYGLNIGQQMTFARLDDEHN